MFHFEAVTLMPGHLGFCVFLDLYSTLNTLLTCFHSLMFYFLWDLNPIQYGGGGIMASPTVFP